MFGKLNEQITSFDEESKLLRLIFRFSGKDLTYRLVNKKFCEIYDDQEEENEVVIKEESTAEDHALYENFKNCVMD